MPSEEGLRRRKQEMFFSVRKRELRQTSLDEFVGEKNG